MGTTVVMECSIEFRLLGFYSPFPGGLTVGVCDEWGGAESRGNGARPVE